MKRSARRPLHAAPRRPLRASGRGQAAVIVALSMVALIAVVGLALDGGMEASNFRQAQNAADAAAAGAARWVYAYEQANGSSPTLAQVTAKVDTYLGENKATRRSITYSPAALPTTPSGSTESNLAEVRVGSAVVGADPSLAGTGTHVLAADSTASIGSGAGGATAAGLAQAAQVDTTTTTTTTLLGVTTSTTSTTTVRALCVSDAATTTSISAPSSCTSTTANYGTLGSQAAQASVDAAGVPAASTQQVVVNPTTGVLSLPLSAGNVSVTGAGTAAADRLAGGALPSAGSDEAVTNLSVNLPGSVVITAAAVAYHLQVASAYTVSSTSPTLYLTATTTCDPVTLNLSIAGSATATIQIGSDCTPIGSLSAAVTSNLAALGITLGFNALTPSSGACPVGAATCTVNACLVTATVKAVASGITVATVCAVQATASLTASGSLTPLGITVVCHIPTATYFLGVLGWTQTDPAATATAQVLNITDVSQSAFSNSPYAVPDTGTASDGKTYSLLSGANIGGVDNSPLGKSFYVYGTSMATYYPTTFNPPSGWQGRVSAPAGHALGSQLAFVTGVGGTPSPFIASGNYYLMPVISPVTRIIEAYAVFTVISGSNFGTLVDSVPANNGPLPQGITSSSSPYFYGEQPYQAVAIKLAA